MGAMAQVFSVDKVVDSPVLNRIGVQPFRAVVARTMAHAHRPLTDPLARELQERGIVVVHDFLPPDDFARSVDEADAFVQGNVPRWLHTEGTTTVRQFHLAGVDADRYPALHAWTRNERVLGTASAIEHRPFTREGVGGPLIEDIVVGDNSMPDPQTRLHVDTFHSTHKAWLFLTDVEMEDGPLKYVPGSHRMDSTRLRADYRHSVGDWFCEQDSRRVPPDEITRRGLGLVALTCPANTLVIADTCGYHGRTEGAPGHHRRALHFSFRVNPFVYRMPQARATLKRVRDAVRPSGAGPTGAGIRS